MASSVYYQLFDREQLTPHNHISLFYKTKEEQLRAIVPYIKVGLEGGEQCLYIADENNVDSVFNSLENGGIDVDKALKSDALMLQTINETYLQGGYFSSDLMLKFTDSAIKSAKKAGFKKLRGTGEMTWILHSKTSTESLLDYEAKVNCLLEKSDLIALCQYNLTCLSTKTLLDILCTHPLIRYDNVVCNNYFYIQADILLKNDCNQVSVERILMKLSETEKEIERLRKQEQLLNQQSRMASIGEMISAISHQWMQPLNAITLIQMDLLDAYDYGDLDKEYLNSSIGRSMQQIKFMSKTIDNFRNFLNPSKLKSEFDVKMLIEEILSMFSDIFRRENISLTLTEENEAGTYIVTGYRNELMQVILNIINNAKDAILNKVLSERNNNGVIVIVLKKEQDKVMLKIRDNGGGIPEDIIDKIFEPYFTTKSSDKGSGIGLYLSKTIIEKNMDGKLTVCNLDEGAEFMIEI
ncbi:MAG: MEDS domain-containing protein [Nitrospirae bacterium]|nr:MEDS domain-containing protein [Nitrospirota bacterium]